MLKTEIENPKETFKVMLDYNERLLKKNQVKKDDELYLLHHKQHQQDVNKLVQNMQYSLSELFGEEHFKQLHNEDPGKERPYRQMGIHNATLKSYAEALVARYGNPQDDGENRNMVNLQDGDGLTNVSTYLDATIDKQSKGKTITKEMQDDISKLTAGLKKLEHDNKDIRLHQQSLEGLVTTKIAAHIEPIREEMNCTFMDQQRKFGTDLEELKQYWTKEQDKRDLARKRETELKELEQRKQRLESEQE